MKLHRMSWCLLGALATGAHAQVTELAHPQWQALYEADQLAQLQQQARTHLAGHRNDPDAVLALALAAAADADQGEAALAQARSCADQQPQAAPCQLALGMLMSQQVANGSPLTAVRYGAAIGQAFAQAVQAQPAYLPARSALVAFYLNAPRIVGGGADKARAAATATPPEQAQYAKILRGQIAAHDDQFDQALKEFRSVDAGGDAHLARRLRLARMDVGLALMDDGQGERACAVFAELSKDFPDRAEGFYGLGRCALQAKQFDGAIAQLDQAGNLAGAPSLPIDQRLGEAYAGKGDKHKARQLLERFLKRPGMLKGNLDGARKLLDELG